jgi:hypothetical protein
MNIPYFLKEYLKNPSMKECNVHTRMGSTDYIDYITENDFKISNTNAIYGYDCASRFFISVLYKIQDGNKDDFPRIMTVFQRYTNEEHFYVSCSDIFKFCDIQTCNFSTGNVPNSFLYFFELIKNGNVSIPTDKYDYKTKTEKQIVNTYLLHNFV